MFNTCCGPLLMSLISSLYGCSKFTEISRETFSSRTVPQSWWAVCGPWIGRTGWKTNSCKGWDTFICMNSVMLSCCELQPYFFFPLLIPASKACHGVEMGLVCVTREFHSRQEWIIWHNTGTRTGSQKSKHPQQNTLAERQRCTLD